MGFFDFLTGAKDQIVDAASQAGLDDVASQASEAANNVGGTVGEALQNPSDIAGGIGEQAGGVVEGVSQKVEDITGGLPDVGGQIDETVNGVKDTFGQN